ncbi:sporulation protein [Mangrovibacillus cuniculi]|uniref:Sporulation protein n=1 Tax=Mangrovibacillus cuniculi TaxID=2593652 RepID=A0A7S8C9W5_9BACI|nr:sporulation protein [Mangrovibacillus cuniculi]QPC46097.1 sporulation protein [Mangrovibacillus cuniculi]
MKKRLSVLLAIALLILVGCTNEKEVVEPNQTHSSLSLIKKAKPAPIELKARPEEDSIGYQVRQLVNKEKELYDAAIIEGEKETLVVYKVKHFKRHQMKEIEKKVRKHLEDKFPEEEFIVSSDYKIFLEAMRLKEKFESGKINQDQAIKRYEEIKKLQKEMT